jgi:hypothetical protein
MLTAILFVMQLLNENGAEKLKKTTFGLCCFYTNPYAQQQYGF